VSNFGRVEFRALGTGCVVTTTDAHSINAACEAVTTELAAIDAACSRFRSDSDLERVNDNAGRAVPVGTLLLDAIDVAIRAAQLTDGDIDPTIGSALITLGYDRDFASLGVQSAGRVHVRRVSGWQCIRADRANGTVAVPTGVRIDLGATAKAWAADRAAQAATAQVAADCGVLVSLGGDISVVNPAPRDGWPVRVADNHAAPLEGDGPIIAIHAGGLATSSTKVRRWQAGASEVHHIIDPHTSAPAAEYWRTVSVAAGSALDANIASTTCIIRGERAIDWLDGVGLPARLVRADGRVTTTNGWPADAPAVSA
jgi:thiamine biosynthesis lipoprotein